jgi:hypothetical protein
MEPSRKTRASLMSFTAKLASGPGTDLSSAAVQVDKVEVIATRVGAEAPAPVVTPLQSAGEVVLIAGVSGDQASGPSAGRTGQGIRARQRRLQVARGKRFDKKHGRRKARRTMTSKVMSSTGWIAWPRMFGMHGVEHAHTRRHVYMSTH